MEARFHHGAQEGNELTAIRNVRYGKREEGRSRRRGLQRRKVSAPQLQLPIKRLCGMRGAAEDSGRVRVAESVRLRPAQAGKRYNQMRRHREPSYTLPNRPNETGQSPGLLRWRMSR